MTHHCRMRTQLTNVMVGAGLALIPYPALPGAVPTATSWGTRPSTSNQGYSPRLVPPATTTATGALMINGGVFTAPAFGTAFVITGTAPVSSPVTLHFHKAGTPATDYSITRTVTADNTGFWIRPIAAIVDYRYYATDDALTSPRVLKAS